MGPTLDVRRVGATNLIARICRELEMDRILNAMLEWDEKQWRVSPGTLLTALVVNLLSERRPLYRVGQFFAEQDLPLLFSEAVSADALNDDALGRALDRLAETDMKRVFTTVACAAVNRDGIPVRSVHGDTTSISLYGEFEPTDGDRKFREEHPELPWIEITHGFSKQHRPDLKQFTYGLVVTSEGIPLYGDVGDGNRSDASWTQQLIHEELEHHFLHPQETVWQFDSSLINPKNLEGLARRKMRFVSRLPGRYQLERRLKEKAWKADRWEPLGILRTTPSSDAAEYWACSLSHSFYGRSYRFVVIRSSSLDRRKADKLERRLAKEAEALDAAIRGLEKQRFACRPDAEQARQAFEKEHEGTLHRLEVHVVEEQTVRRRRGRPRKGETPPVVLTYRLTARREPPSEATRKAILEQESAFVLITNLPEDAYGNREILELYKGQTNAELGFRFLDKPLLVDGVYLKSTRRVQALAYVILLALLVAVFLQRRIRVRLQETGETLTPESRPPTDRPTIRVILDLLRPLVVIFWQSPEGVVRQFPRRLDPQIPKILRLAGYDEAIYLQRAAA